MKPLEKYQQKFIQLLKEAEEELGGPLKVRVSSHIATRSNNDRIYLANPERDYKCSIMIGDDIVV